MPSAEPIRSLPADGLKKGGISVQEWGVEMNRYEWKKTIGPDLARRRAGGRRRYNAKRRRRAEARRGAISNWLAENPTAAIFSRGLPAALAPAFGVHPSTIWRDLQWLLYGGSAVNFYSGDKHLFSITRAYPGGPVLSVTGPEGQEIRGPARRSIIRSLPRYVG